MTKPFKKLLGNRIYLIMPVIPESILVLPEEVKKQLISSEQEKFQKLKVYAVGDTISIIQEGDMVLIEPTALANAPVIMVSIFNIIHIW
jgi:hypothetical protein